MFDSTHISPAPATSAGVNRAVRDAAAQGALERNVHVDALFDLFQDEFAQVCDLAAGWTETAVGVRINCDVWIDVPVDWDELEATGHYGELADAARNAVEKFIAANPSIEVDPADHIWTGEREWLVYHRGQRFAEEFRKLSSLELGFGPDRVVVYAESGEQVAMFVDWWSMGTANDPADEARLLWDIFQGKSTTRQVPANCWQRPDRLMILGAE